MTTEDFWKKYTNEDILDIFDETCDFFSKELPEAFKEEYDVGEIIIETRGHQETAKNFDNVIKFTNILQNKQPQLYNEFFPYFNDFLIDYYCFRQDMSKANKAFSLFIDKPLQEVDQYLLGFKKVLFYQQSELLEQAISKNFTTLNQLTAGAEYDLAMCKFQLALQELYKRHKQNLDKGDFSSQFSDCMRDYNFDFNDDFLAAIEVGMLKPPLEADRLKDLFSKDPKNTLNIIMSYFLRHMHEKGFEFCLSGRIWDGMLEYWHRNNRSQKTMDSYFKIQTKSFKKYLEEYLSAMFSDNKSEMIAVLWGGVYIYEFFYKFHIISEKAFHSFIKTSQTLKGKVIGQYTADLWNSNFIHSWKKPECISETEFVEENNIFKKSISFKYQKFTKLRKNISEELSKIGELSHFIIEGGKNDSSKYNNSLPNNLFDPLEEEHWGSNMVHTPIRTEKKIGRNESCPCGSGKKYKKCCL